MENHFDVKQLVQLAILAAVSYVLMLIAIPIIPVAPYMKLDLSDLPILIGTMMMGISAGITIATVKSLLYWITIGGASLPSLIGVFSSWAASIVLLLAVFFVLKSFKSHTRKLKWIMMIILATLALTIAMSLLNLYVVTPLYINMIGLKLSFSVPKLVAIAVIPFNIIKGIVIGIIFAIIYPQLSKIIK
ncbi:riboflavin transporter [Philodulcilactobacillus myokoensis]|uniref:Riboflavin transporter n=1 Tax=Philodulcilactobacillus myokoensis TaxID=2929573 RepID=A0A9W6AZX9_9LACO|nr:ECF transporter S component [Philodulcilactobacillus myokoensis]GLB46405.1 riboflavin transporter [Philodulcilactobacillus myokoensis]